MRLCIFFLGVFSSLWGKPLKVEITAPSAIVMNADTGAILYAKNIHERNYPASTTKVATALYVLEKKGEKLDEFAQASPNALKTIPAHIRQAPDSKHPPHSLETDGTSMGIHPGEIIPLKALLYGLLLSSGNDAGNVLAETVSGSIDKFVEEMHQFLWVKGIRETHFVNPHGLHHDAHWTTAYDMALMTRLALKHPAFREMVKTVRYQSPKTNKQPAQYLAQHNRLVKPGPFFYPKAIGVKTGYTAKAGYTFVGAATHAGRTLIAVLFNCAESDQRFKEATKLFEAAFAEKLVSRVLFAKESDHFTHLVPGAKGPLEAMLKEDLILEYYPAEEPLFRAEIEWLKCKFPIQAGDKVGFLRLVAQDGTVLGQLPLCAVHPVSQTAWAYMTGLFRSYKTALLALFLSGQVVLLLLYFLKKNQKIV